MKLLIEIPEKTYHMINDNFYDYGDMNIIIQNGIPIKNGGICDLCKNQELGTIAVCFHCTASLKKGERKK